MPKPIEHDFEKWTVHGSNAGGDYPAAPCSPQEKCYNLLWAMGEKDFAVGVIQISDEEWPPTILSRRPEYRSLARWKKIRKMGINVEFVHPKDHRISVGCGARIVGKFPSENGKRTDRRAETSTNTQDQ